MKRKTRNEIQCLAMVAPPVLAFIVFGLIPAGISFYLSFCELHDYDFSMARFIGFANYRKIFTDPLVCRSILNTLWFWISSPLKIALGLGIALIFNRKLPGEKVFRTLLFIPYLCSAAAAVIVWKWIFNGEFGIINQFITDMGGARVNFFLNKKWYMWILILINVWGGTGYTTILFQAALTGVNKSCLEAAELDGAGSIQKFFRVTFPSISPTTFFLLVTGLMGSLQAFSEFQMIGVSLPDGFQYGPDNTGITIVYYLYNMGFREVKAFGMGMASALAVVLIAFILILTAVQFYFQKKWVHYDE